MKLILTGLVALAMAGAPLMARQEPQEDKDKPKKEEPKKPEPKAKPETKPKQEPQPKPDEKQQPKPDPKTDKERAKQDEKQQREETRPAPQKQSAQQAPAQGHEQGGGQARGGGRGQRIPEERFRASFGREHHFHVRRDQRFQYGGYWFEVAQPWPAAWVFDDDCFVEEDGDTYYLVDAMHPDVRVVVIVVEG